MQFRSCIRIACLLVAFVALASTPQTLRDAANATGVLIGTAVRPYLLSEAAYSATLAHEFNMVEPEDALKWWTIRPTAESFDFKQGDQIVSFAEVHGIKVRGHCLVWDHNNPKWLAEGHFSPAQLSQLLHEHITTVMKHYAGHVFAWDVVNEGLDEKGTPRDSPWYNRPGIGLSDQRTAYIEQAFRWAHEADPKALLFYNEAEGDTLNRKSDAIFAMVRDFKNRGIPIDGVGLQLHLPRLDYDTGSVAANIERLTKLGLQVHITELDVALPVDSQGTPRAEDLQRQADAYQRVVRACLQNSGCTAIQTWGFTDKYSWIGSHSHGTQGAGLLFDRAYKPKPAYDAMLKELAAGRTLTH
jgi:endo-1,4-beta-xylanase